MEDLRRKSEPGKNILAGYEVCRPLGEGGYAKVLEGRRLSSDEFFALKIIPKKKDESKLKEESESSVSPSASATKSDSEPSTVNKVELANSSLSDESGEIDVNSINRGDKMGRRAGKRRNLRSLSEAATMARLSHDNIIKLRDQIETKDATVLVMDLAPGGDLMDKILAMRKGNRSIPETLAKNIFGQVCMAVDHCHRHEIIHCDIKPENCFFDEKNRVFLGDYGLATQMDKKKPRQARIGTLHYTAPEVLERQSISYEYQPMVDIWSLGVTLYTMLTGHYPYYHQQREKLIALIHGQKEPVFPFFLSFEVCDLIRGMLTIDPTKRLSLKKVMNHRWLKSEMDTLMKKRRQKKLTGLRSYSTNPHPLPAPEDDVNTQTVRGRADSVSDRQKSFLAFKEEATKAVKIMEAKKGHAHQVYENISLTEKRP